MATVLRDNLRSRVSLYSLPVNKVLSDSSIAEVIKETLESFGVLANIDLDKQKHLPRQAELWTELFIGTAHALHRRGRQVVARPGSGKE